MSTRTKKTTVTFLLPFVLDGSDRELPAGDYQLATDEELIEGLSFPAYRRVATHLYIHPKPGVTEMLAVSWADVATAQLRDEIAAKNKATGERAETQAAPTLKSSIDHNSAPSRSDSSVPGPHDGPRKDRKDMRMKISPPIVVSAIVMFGLAITTWLIPPEPEGTDRTVSLSASTFKQLQLWSKQRTKEIGQALSVGQLIEHLANDWQKANPSSAKPAQASD